MEELLNRSILWGIPVWKLLASFILIVLSLFSRRFVIYIFGGWIRRRTKENKISWDDDVVTDMARPLALFIQVLLAFSVARFLELPEEPNNIRKYVYTAFEVAMWVAATWVLYRVIDIIAKIGERAASKTETKLDDQLVPLLRKASKVLLGVVIAVTVLQNLDINVTSLVASLGIGGLVLALAAKDTVSNFFGSLVVFTDQPFQIGDWVEIGSVEGVVEEVGFRTTRIRRFDKSQVIMPNQLFTVSSIVNHSRRPRRRIKFEIGLARDTTPDEIRAFLVRLNQLLEQHPGIDEGHKTAFTAFGESSLNIMINAFTISSDWSEYLAAQEKLLLGLMDLVEELNLELAYPTRTIHVRHTEPSEQVSSQS